MSSGTDNLFFHACLVVVIFLYSAVSMSVLGWVVPFIPVISDLVHVPPGSVGASLSFFSVPAAFLSFLFGMVVDRLGTKGAFALSICLTVLGDGLLMAASGIWSIRCGLMLCGCGFAFATSVAPALFMAVTPQSIRGRALAFWSTFGPAGYSAGLLLAIPYLSHADWRTLCITHIILMLCLLALGGGLLLMAETARTTTADDTQAPRQRPAFLLIVALGLAVTLPNAVAYGTSLIAPAYLARVYHVSLAASSADVALIKITVMLFGGIVSGLCVGTESRARRMFVVMAVLGVCAQMVLLVPGPGIVFASVGLFLWTFAYSGLSGAGMSLLPIAARDERSRGAVSGTVGQFISVSAVIVPYVYFSRHSWPDYIMMAAVGLGVACLAIARVRRPLSQA